MRDPRDSVWTTTTGNDDCEQLLADDLLTASDVRDTLHGRQLTDHDEPYDAERDLKDIIRITASLPAASFQPTNSEAHGKYDGRHWSSPSPGYHGKCRHGARWQRMVSAN